MKEPGSVLIVEDNPNDAELALITIRKLGLPHEINLATDGTEAFEFLFQRGKYSHRKPSEILLVLLDIKMPKIDGFEVLRQIRKDAKMRRVPVVIFSSSKQESDIQAGYELGANGYVVKPVDFAEFTAVITDVIRFWTLRNEPVPGVV